MSATEPSAMETETSTMQEVKRVAFYISVLATLAAFLITTGELFLLLGLGFVIGEELGIHQLHVMGIAIGVFFAFLGVLVQLYKPIRRVASFQAAAILLLIAAIIFTVIPNETAVILYPFVGAFILMGILHPAGTKLLTVRNRYSPAVLGLTLLAAIPLLAFAVDQLTLQMSGDEHALMGHYGMMATVSLTILAAGLLVSFQSIGYRLLGWLTAFMTAYFGVLSVALQPQASNVGVLWGALAIVWAIALVVATEMTLRNPESAYFNRILGEREETVTGKPA
ncbi:MULTISPECIES: hypothetical protein [unclassified Haladaptatus]|uniref:hypothetical protein n=1 Tax=unclassified Haladaptatus TaxID=2622732 RepID=UPI0023E79285|nr:MULTISPECIES: hypothetical protein [unclassified Haladaptatus]